MPVVVVERRSQLFRLRLAGRFSPSFLAFRRVSARTRGTAPSRPRSFEMERLATARRRTPEDPRVTRLLVSVIIIARSDGCDPCHKRELYRSFSAPDYTLDPYDRAWSHYYGPLLHGAAPPTFAQHILSVPIAWSVDSAARADAGVHRLASHAAASSATRHPREKASPYPCDPAFSHCTRRRSAPTLDPGR